MTAGDSGELAITLGVEEEFFLLDPESGDLLVEPDPGIFQACERNAGAHKVVPELLRSQIEINTRVGGSVGELRAALCETRGLVVEAAAEHGAAVTWNRSRNRSRTASIDWWSCRSRRKSKTTRLSLRRADRLSLAPTALLKLHSGDDARESPNREASDT